MIVVMLVIVLIVGIELGCFVVLVVDIVMLIVIFFVECWFEVWIWLIYLEWYIVYLVESLGCYLVKGGWLSGYDYGVDVVGFWCSYCVINCVVGV